jgi:hypothetical protein
VEPPPEPPDFYDVLYGRNARIVASFDLEGFSVWFAITPLWDGENSRWDFANGGNAGIPLTVAVVRESAGRYGLVEELEADLDLRLEEWDFAEMPEEVPQMRNRHLRSVGGYGFTNFFNTGIFSGNENVRRQALVVAYACDKDSGFAVYRPQAS